MDKNSQSKILTLHVNAQAWAKAHLEALNKYSGLPRGWSFRIVSAHRTWAEQDKLYAQGRSAPGNVVTKARGGQSNHNFQIAWDIGLFNNHGEYLGDHHLYRAVGHIGVALGLDWGGNWKSFQDAPHYQVKTGLSTAELRALVLEGKPIPVPSLGNQPAAQVDNTVAIYDGKRKTDVIGFVEQGRVWVPVRKFTNEFGGEVSEATANHFVVSLDDEAISFPGQTIQGVGYAKFADINRALGWGFQYSARRLTIITGADL